MMRLFAVGLSHRTAPVELREWVDFSRGGADAALSALAGRGIGARNRSCCRPATAPRSTRSPGPRRRTRVGRFFSEYHELPLARLAEHLYVRRGDEAARHLFRVAAGLDSLVVGEPQILGQVKAAYATASDRGYTAARSPTGCFTRRSASASACARETGLGEGAVSVSYAAIALARKIFGDLHRPQRADPRRRRDGEAHRRAPPGAAGPADHDRRAARWRPRERLARRARRPRGRRGTTLGDALRPPTSSSPPPARPSRC